MKDEIFRVESLRPSWCGTPCLCFYIRVVPLLHVADMGNHSQSLLSKHYNWVLSRCVASPTSSLYKVFILFVDMYK